MPTKTPRRKPSRSNSGLPVVEMEVTFRGRNAKVIGALYARTRNRVILLNNVRDGADIGKLKKIRLQHINPEADITVFPLNTIRNIWVLR